MINSFPINDNLSAKRIYIRIAMPKEALYIRAMDLFKES